MDRDATGKDGVLIVNGQEFPFTNEDHSVEWGEDSSDYNDRVHTHHRKTNKDSGGSIEVEASTEELKFAVMDGNGNQRDDIRILMKGAETADRFTGVTITEFGEEYPGGGTVTTSVSWVANDHRPIRLS